MITLSKAVHAWNTPAFESVLKEEIESLDGKLLPLQQGLARTSYALTDDFHVRIIGASEDAGEIHVKAGISYSGIIPGCSCADDPTPIDEVPEYAVVRFDINKETAQTRVMLLESE